MSADERAFYVVTDAAPGLTAIAELLDTWDHGRTQADVYETVELNIEALRSLLSTARKVERGQKCGAEHGPLVAVREDGTEVSLPELPCCFVTEGGYQEVDQ